jgi:hypothetical protein
MNKYLIIIPAGDESYHYKCKWFCKNKIYDLCVNYYGVDININNTYEQTSDYYFTFKGSKWQILKQVLETKTFNWKQYEYIWIPDDDLDISTININIMFETAKSYKLKLSQPSLYDLNLSHSSLKHDTNCIIRYTNFIEIQCPLFHIKSLIKIKQTLNNVISGWGLDYVWSKLFKPDIAIIDIVYAIHTRPLQAKKKGSFYNKLKIDPYEEFKHTLKKYKITKVKNKIIKCIPTPEYCTYNIYKQYFNELNEKEIFCVNLFKQINIDLEPFKNGISHTTLNNMSLLMTQHNNIAGIHIKIINNTLQIVRENQGFETRNQSVIKLLNEVLQRYSIPDLEVFFITNDFISSVPLFNKLPFFVMAKKQNHNNILYPDFTYNEWLEAKTFGLEKEKNRILIIANKIKFKKRNSKIFFRGAKTHYMREYIHTKSINNNDSNTFDIITLDSLNTNKFVYLKDHSYHKYLIHIPGRSYSSRLKYLFFTKSLVYIIIKLKQYEWIEFWYHILEPNKHFIMISDNNKYDKDSKIMKTNGKYNDTHNHMAYNQIKESVEFYNNNEAQAEIIAQNGHNLVANVLTIDNIYRYYAVLLIKYSALCKL